MLLAALTVLLAQPVTVVNGFAFVPVLSFFTKPDPTGDKARSQHICAEGGGFIVAEPSASLHERVIEEAKKAGAGEEWYAYLGSSTHDRQSETSCPNALVNAPTSAQGATDGCRWRWNQGRWAEMPDDTTLPYYIPKVGVTHFMGNYYALPGGSSASHIGPKGDFPHWFDLTNADLSERRPNGMNGQDLLLVGTGSTTRWSDNLATGGYTYAGYTYSNSVLGIAFDEAAQAATKDKFYAICYTQGSSRASMEQYDTSNVIELNWWAIYLVLLFVICLIAVIVIGVCQEREDMDEPPEDAPAWAEEQVKETKQTKQFVSHRSLRQHDDDGDGQEMDFADKEASPTGSSGAKADNPGGKSSMTSDGPDNAGTAYPPSNPFSGGYQQAPASPTPPPPQEAWI